jgi:hypothetical protein
MPPVSRSNPPVCDDKRADEAGKRIHPEPTERARHQQPGNDQNGHGGIGQNVNDGRPHVVVAVMRAMGCFMIVLLAFQFVLVSLAVLSGLLAMGMAMVMVVGVTMAGAVMMPAGQ